MFSDQCPEILPLIKTENICFLHLDMNVALPEGAAAEFLWDRMVPGAIIISDDYARVRHDEQMKTLDCFASERSHEVLSLPTGQGMIVKR